MILNHNFCFDKIPCLLFILLPIFFITGPFLTDLSISLIAIIFLVEIFKKKNFEYFKNYFFYILAIFNIYIILNSLMQNQNFDSIKISIFYFRFLLFSLAVWSLLDKNSRILNQLYFCILVCIISLLATGYYEFFFYENVILGKDQNIYRISSFFGEELILGSYLSRMFPIFFGLSIFLKKFKKKKNLIILSVLFVLIEGLVFFSGERSSFFFINLSTIFMILMLKNYKKVRIITFFLSILLIFTISVFDQRGFDRIFKRTFHQMFLLDKSENIYKKKYFISENHDQHYISAIKMFKKNIFFGVGVKNFRNFCKDGDYYISEKGCSNHPHNSYIQLLAETGLIGFSLIFLFLIILIYSITIHFMNIILSKKRKFNDFEISLLAAILISLWPIIPTGNFFNNWLSGIYYFPAGMLLWSLNRQIEQ